MAGRLEDFGFFLTRTFASTKRKKAQWPFVLGKYFVIDSAAPVAVTTLGSVDLAEKVSSFPPDGLCIVGKVETENIGIEKIIKNVISNPAIRYLICAGDEPPKHLTGATIMALFQNGVDGQNRIVGSPGMRPILPNTSPEEIDQFRRQVEPIDMIGCRDVTDIHKQIAELATAIPKASLKGFRPAVSQDQQEEVECVMAEGTDPMRIKLDRAGYFVINIENNTLLVEHYDYKEKLLRIIEGDDARSIYLTIVRNGWISRLDHAAYFGRQLARAEHSIQEAIDYVQDGA
jgi:tetrahydromethanopterin S-methyltransferase subunit A